MLNAFLPYLRNSSWLLGAMKLGAGFHLSKSAEERRLLRKCFLSFSGISDATETCWHAAVMIATLLDFFKKGKHRVLQLTPGLFAHLHLNHVVTFRQALWSCWELLSPPNWLLSLSFSHFSPSPAKQLLWSSISLSLLTDIWRVSLRVTGQLLLLWLTWEYQQKQ